MARTEHENLPPAGYVQVGAVLVHDDNHEMPPGVEPVLLAQSVYPGLTRLLNSVREDNGGPSWAAQTETEVPAYWQPHLAAMEAAAAGLSDTMPAPENTEVPQEPVGSYLDTELYSYVSSDEELMGRMGRRSYAMTALGNFLGDFFEGWAYREELTVDGEFRPQECLLEDVDGMAPDSDAAAAEYAARTDRYWEN